MGIFDEIKKTQTPGPARKQPVIKAKKRLKKKYVFGCVSNGDALIRLDEEYAIKVIALDNENVELILLDYGKEIEMKPQGWQKTKKVESTIGNKNLKLEVKTPIRKESLFKND